MPTLNEHQISMAKLNGGTVSYKFDSDANDSDKSWVVPTGKVWYINWAHVILTTTATAGNRVMTLEVLDDSSNDVLDIHPGAVQAASNVYHYTFMQGVYREATVNTTAIVSPVTGTLQIPIPKDLMLKPGWTIRIYDAAAIAAAADDMTVSFQYIERDA